MPVARLIKGSVGLLVFFLGGLFTAARGEILLTSGENVSAETIQLSSGRTIALATTCVGCKLGGSTSSFVHAQVAKAYQLFHELLKYPLPAKNSFTLRLFTTPADFQQYQAGHSTTHSTVGFHLGAQDEIVVMVDLSQGKLARVLCHEMVHSLLERYAPGVPRWLQEGLGEYFENIRLQNTEPSIAVSISRAAMLRVWQRDKRLMSLDDFFVKAVEPWDNKSPAELDTLYTISWGLVYYLMSDETGRGVVRSVIAAGGSKDALDHYYPGGIVRLEQDWTAWIKAPQTTGGYQGM